MATVTDPVRGPGDRDIHDRHVPQTSMVAPAEDLRTVALNQISWGAVFAGATAALVLQVILNMLGLGIGLSTIDPAGDGTPGASSLGLTGDLMRQFTDIYPSHAEPDWDPRLIGVARGLGEILGPTLAETPPERLMRLAAQVDDRLRDRSEREGC